MSLPRYAEYKDSGVAWLGEVPAHWRIKRLKFSLRLLTEKTSRRTNPVALENIESWSGRFQSTETEFQGEGTAFEEGDVLFGKLRPYLAKVLLANSPGEAVGDFHVLRPITGVVPRFAQYQLLSREFIAVVDGSTFGSKMPRVSWEFLANLPLMLPGEREQSAIATFLDRETGKIDALIAEQEKLLTLLAEKRQATISHAVTRGLNPNAPMKDSGVPWLGEVPIHWKKMKLLDLAAREQHAFVNGPFGSDLLTAELVDEGVPVIYIRDIKDDGYRRISEWYVTQEKADQLKFCSVMAGDVIIAKVGDPPGLAAVYPNDEPVGIVTQDVIRLRLNTNKAMPGYVRWLLNSDYGKTMVDDISVESTRTRVGLGEYKQLRFFLPSVQEQGAIASLLDREVAHLTALRLEAKSGIDLLKERRSALIAAAVTGKIDVRHAA